MFLWRGLSLYSLAPTLSKSHLWEILALDRSLGHFFSPKKVSFEDFEVFEASLKGLYVKIGGKGGFGEALLVTATHPNFVAGLGGAGVSFGYSRSPESISSRAYSSRRC
jgi:hypothetical protein